ncbi:class I SAM-dependent methyltransferase [Lichenihabitans psoromatis]|uniref:class I SAM-dependent methyltransferase n=1 Tax=Lichenihabitans psoromatis TaxID=2528642 RepID=UPI0013F15162|nr:class I SAM-dependent methyltransferase [Lichenihabitans psoromatis]
MTAPGRMAQPRIDFVGGALGHRLRAGGPREPLAKAVGFGNGHRPTIVDATAGLGRDAFLLAALGLKVTLIERSPAVHALLADGLARASEAGPDIAVIVARMTLLAGDAKHHLAGLRPDVVLVDPMHPPRLKSALVKQEMRDLRALVGADLDAPALMQAALAAATNRVVLKWPLRAEPMPGLDAPHHQVLSKTLRFDVFMV